ncbi:MAG: hypothetical protein Kow00114_03130 [Kiloniellaceae bacterium]
MNGQGGTPVAWRQSPRWIPRQRSRAGGETAAFACDRYPVRAGRRFGALRHGDRIGAHVFSFRRDGRKWRKSWGKVSRESIGRGLVPAGPMADIGGGRLAADGSLANPVRSGRKQP